MTEPTRPVNPSMALDTIGYSDKSVQTVDLLTSGPALNNELECVPVQGAEVIVGHIPQPENGASGDLSPRLVLWQQALLFGVLMAIWVETGAAKWLGQ